MTNATRSPSPYSDRLSALDASFLTLESDAAPIHVGALLVFDGRALLDRRDALPMERLRRYVDHALDSCERYRQHLARAPGFRQPVWVDDERFDLDFHLRRAGVPAPGTNRELREVVSRILSQRLDRSRPLWEMYFVDGLRDGRFALVVKAHHCMVDGVGGMQLLMSLLRPHRNTKVPETPSCWSPRPAPSGWAMFRDELDHRAKAAASLVRSIDIDALRRGMSGIRSAARKVSFGWRPRTGFTSPDVSADRRFEWTSFDLDTVKAVKTSLGGTVNDVVLAAVAGAARKHLRRNGIDPDAVEPLRTVLPVHTGASTRDAAGNQVSMVMASLPVNEQSPAARVQRVAADTSRLKNESNQAEGAKLFEDIADATTQKMLSGAFKLALHAELFDMVVTNIRGPSFPLYLLDARLLSVYPMVPLMPRQNLGLAIFSYDGHVHWGFNADSLCFSQVEDFVSDLEASFEELQNSRDETAGTEGATPTTAESAGA